MKLLLLRLEVKRIKLMRSRFVEYANGKRNGALTVFVMVFDMEMLCYHSVQNLLSSRLLSKNLKTMTYRTIILPVVLYGCKTWSLTLREERKLRVFENMVLRRISGRTR